MVKLNLKPGLLNKECIIYVLYKNKKAMYVGETCKGLKRVFQHYLKVDFNSIEIYDAPKEKRLRLILETEYIYKLKPKLNMTLYNPIKSELLEKGYYLEKEVRLKLKKYGYYNITQRLLYNIRKYCTYEMVGASMYIEPKGFNKFLKKEYDINFIELNR